jgi:predicted nucleic acid-binding Zn ribbon protein
MAKFVRNQNAVEVKDILKLIIQQNNLQSGINEVKVRDAWKNLMGNGINKYTTHLILKNKTLYVSLSSSVLRDELSYGKDKIVKLINEELGNNVIEAVVLK